VLVPRKIKMLEMLSKAFTQDCCGYTHKYLQETLEMHEEAYFRLVNSLGDIVVPFNGNGIIINKDSDNVTIGGKDA